MPIQTDDDLAARRDECVKMVYEVIAHDVAIESLQRVMVSSGGVSKPPISYQDPRGNVSDATFFDAHHKDDVTDDEDVMYTLPPTAKEYLQETRRKPECHQTLKAQKRFIAVQGHIRKKMDSHRRRGNRNRDWLIWALDSDNNGPEPSIEDSDEEASVPRTLEADGQQ